MYKYKNISENDQSIVGVGLVLAGQEFQSPRLIENPNIERLGGSPEVSAPAEITNNEEKE